MAAQPSNAGIVTNDSGERHIPESTRPDGTTRKSIKIRPGYRPPEDVELYRSRTAEAFRERGKRLGVVPGAIVKDDDKDDGDDRQQQQQQQQAPSGSAAAGSSNKNAKRREARKKAAAAAAAAAAPKDGADVADGGGDKAAAGAAAGGPAVGAAAGLSKDVVGGAKDDKQETTELDPEAEKLKKVRNLKKKLKQARDLKSKKEEGEALLPEQIAKVIKISELIRELDALGFDNEGEPKGGEGQGVANKG
jgi:partner of Y14 and mago